MPYPRKPRRTEPSSLSPLCHRSHRGGYTPPGPVDPGYLIGELAGKETVETRCHDRIYGVAEGHREHHALLARAKVTADIFEQVGYELAPVAMLSMPRRDNCEPVHDWAHRSLA
jgi:hypothetical protein